MPEHNGALSGATAFGYILGAAIELEVDSGSSVRDVTTMQHRSPHGGATSLHFHTVKFRSFAEGAPLERLTIPHNNNLSHRSVLLLGAGFSSVSLIAVAKGRAHHAAFFGGMPRA